MNITQEVIQIMQERILSWYVENGRILPRRLTQDPYAIHISEVMSQQTQVDRVIPYREKWMKAIPDYKSLSEISKSDLLAYRSGLGFNSRALRLQECARVVVDSYQGALPQNRSDLLSFPGIGPYTASAICAFAWNQNEVVIDTNIRRVLIFLLELDPNISLNELEKVAKNLIPVGRSRDWHNALMDYGAMHLTAKKTKIKSLGKQSRFEGSDRQVRGWILKQLTANPQALSLHQVLNEFPHKNVENIIQGMQRDGLIVVKDDFLLIE